MNPATTTTVSELPATISVVTGVLTITATFTSHTKGILEVAGAVNGVGNFEVWGGTEFDVGGLDFNVRQCARIANILTSTHKLTTDF